MNTKKIFVQVIDKRTGIYQTGMIEEPVVEGSEASNALLHFGVSFGSVDWIVSENGFRCGNIQNTTKVVLLYEN